MLCSCAMGFASCDTWSDSPAVLSLRAKIPESAHTAVRCLVLDDDE